MIFQPAVYPPTGEVHPRHAAPLHLQSQRNDQVGAGDLRGGEAPGDSAHRWTGEDLGPRGPQAVPGQTGVRRGEDMDRRERQSGGHKALPHCGLQGQWAGSRSGSYWR